MIAINYAQTPGLERQRWSGNTLSCLFFFFSFLITYKPQPHFYSFFLRVVHFCRFNTKFKSIMHQCKWQDLQVAVWLQKSMSFLHFHKLICVFFLEFLLKSFIQHNFWKICLNSCLDRGKKTPHLVVSDIVRANNVNSHSHLHNASAIKTHRFSTNVRRLWHVLLAFKIKL